MPLECLTLTSSVPAWLSMATTLVAVSGAWLTGRRGLLQRAQRLVETADRVAGGEFSVRTPLEEESGTIGDLARRLHLIAEKLERGVEARSDAEKTLLNRSLRQTVVSALGQFALVSGDFSSLLNQAAILVSQTLEFEYCAMLELLPGGDSLLLREGVGWRSGLAGNLILPIDPAGDLAFTLMTGEPVVFERLDSESRFQGSQLLVDHGVVSGVNVAVAGYGRFFGVLGAYTSKPRRISEDEAHFLLAVGSLVAMAMERSQAEAQLLKLAAITRLNPTPTMEFTSEGQLAYFNDAARDLALKVGCQNTAGILPEDMSFRVATCLATGQDIRDMKTVAGQRTLSWMLHPVIANQVVHGYVEDITDRMSLEAQLRQSQKMESVGQLAAGLAHDFNNMLTVIQGHSGILLAGNDLPPMHRESAQAILLASERSAGLTRQLLTFSRKTVIQPGLLDLRQVVAHTVKMLQRLLGGAIVLEFETPAGLPCIEADTGMVEQVLMNLAVNARDAMPNGGTLGIGLSEALIGDEEARAKPQVRPGLFVCLCVTDTGCGMDESTIMRIFEPFFTTKVPGKGTGLGLATVYGIVRQHGGWIDVTSQPGKGSSFRVYFPASDRTANNEPSISGGVDEIPRGQERVLVVEDEPALLEMAKFMLEDCGYEVLTASSGPEATQVWEQHHGNIDLLLTDLVMPGGISGLDLARNFRVDNPSTKILFTSGHALEEIQERFLKDGTAGFLQKPYSFPTLAKAVRDCIDA